MGFKSIFTKGVALAASGKCRRHSQKATNYARQAFSQHMDQGFLIIFI